MWPTTTPSTWSSFSTSSRDCPATGPPHPTLHPYWTLHQDLYCVLWGTPPPVRGQSCCSGHSSLWRPGPPARRPPRSEGQDRWRGGPASTQTRRTRSTPVSHVKRCSQDTPPDPASHVSRLLLHRGEVLPHGRRPTTVWPARPGFLWPNTTYCNNHWSLPATPPPRRSLPSPAPPRPPSSLLAYCMYGCLYVCTYVCVCVCVW